MTKPVQDVLLLMIMSKQVVMTKPGQDVLY